MIHSSDLQILATSQLQLRIKQLTSIYHDSQPRKHSPNVNPHILDPTLGLVSPVLVRPLLAVDEEAGGGGDGRSRTWSEGPS